MRGQKLKRDALTNVVGGFVVAGTLMWMIRVASGVFEPAILGFFLLARRIGGLGANLLQLGISQTLYRYLPISADNKETQREYVSFAILVWLIELIVFIPLAYGLRGLLAEWCFPGFEDNEALSFYTVLLMLSIVLNFFVNPILFSNRQIFLSKAVELSTTSGSLLVLLLVLGKRSTPSIAVGFQAAAMTAIGLVTLGFLLLRPNGLRSLHWKVKRETRLDFVKYGLPRCPITFLSMGIWVVGPWLLRDSPDEAGFLIIAMTIIRVLDMFVTPITKLASVVTARYVGLGDEASIQEGLRLVFGMGVYVPVLVMAVLVPWRGEIYDLWLGNPTLVEGASRWFVLVCWGALPLVLFHALQGIIEVRWVAPFNLYTLVTGFVLQFSVYYLGRPFWGGVQAVGISLLVMLWAIGIMTVWRVARDIRPISRFGFGHLVVAAGLIGLSNVWAQTAGAIWAFALAIVATVVILVLLGTVFSNHFVREIMVWVRLPYTRTSE